VNDERKCEGCKWSFGTKGYANGCISSRTAYLSSNRNRESVSDCGPAGRYWEPREETK